MIDMNEFRFKPANPDIRFVVCTLCERVIRVINLNEELL